MRYKHITAQLIAIHSTPVRGEVDAHYLSSACRCQNSRQNSNFLQGRAQKPYRSFGISHGYSASHQESLEYVLPGIEITFRSDGI